MSEHVRAGMSIRREPDGLHIDYADQHVRFSARLLELIPAVGPEITYTDGLLDITTHDGTHITYRINPEPDRLVDERYQYHLGERIA